MVGNVFAPGDLGLVELAIMMLAILCGLAVRLTLGAVGQQWARTYSNTVTYLLLPVVGLVIVQVISGSIALSLGMIGALSIVRFRHPVKSPLELVVFFLLLTIGVALSARTWIGVVLTIVACGVIIVVSAYQRWQARAGRVAFPLAPGDGQQQWLLEVSSSRPLDDQALGSRLVISSEDVSLGQYMYKYAFESRSELDDARRKVLSFDGVTSVVGTYS